MSLELTIGRNSELYHGFSLSDSNGNNLLRIDGKKEDNIPVLLLTVDPHTVYGLSHPKVINKILATGPNLLITQKKFSHILFEHGMKASWGTIKVMNNKFQTSVETFYDVKYRYTIANYNGHNLDVTSYLLEEVHYASLTYKNQTYHLSNVDIKPLMSKGDKFINLSSIKDYVSLVFNGSETSTFDNSGTRGA